MPNLWPSCRHWRLIAWSLVVLALVGLGLALKGRVAPEARSIISIEGEGTLGWLSGDGATLVTYGGQGWIRSVQVWDTYSGHEIATFPMLEWLDTQPIFSKSGRFLTGVTGKGTFFLIDIKAGRESRIPLKGMSGETQFLFSPNEDLLAAYSCPQFVATSKQWSRNLSYICHLVETKSGRLVQTFDGTINDGAFFDFSSQLGLFLLGITDFGQNALRLWDTRSRKLKRTLKNINPIQLSPDGRKLLATTPKDYVLLDVATGNICLSLPFVGAKGYFSPDGRTLVTRTFLATFTDRSLAALGNEKVPEAVLLKLKTMKDRTVGAEELYKLLTKRELERILPLMAKHAIFDLEKERIDFWDAGSGKKLGGDESLAFYGIGFSPDSAFCFMVSLDPTTHLKLWDVKSARLLWQVDLGWCRDQQFTADSRFLVLHEESIQIREAKTGQVRKKIPTTSGPTVSPRHVVMTRQVVVKPGPFGKLFGNWWPLKEPPPTSFMSVIELPDGGEAIRLEIRNLSGSWLSDDGRTLVTRHKGKDAVSLHCWTLPVGNPHRPVWQVAGLPIGLGLLILLAAWFRKRRRVHVQAVC